MGISLIVINKNSFQNWSLSYNDSIIQLIILILAVPYFVGFIMYLGKVNYLQKSTMKKKKGIARK